MAKKGKKKTVKAIAKRVKKLKSGGLKRRKAGQGHFNTREGGKKMRNKRNDRGVAKADERNAKRAIN